MKTDAHTTTQEPLEHASTLLALHAGGEADREAAEAMVPPAMWGCKPHWFKLPYGLRALIWSTYEIGQEERMDPSEGYLDAAHEVQEWIREHYPEQKALDV